MSGAANCCQKVQEAVLPASYEVLSFQQTRQSLLKDAVPAPAFTIMSSAMRLLSDGKRNALPGEVPRARHSSP